MAPLWNSNLVCDCKQQMEAVDNRKNLFIQIKETKEESLHRVLSSWGRPPPLEYHLINAPALNYQLATLPAHSPKQQTEFFPQRNRDLAKLPKRNNERERFKRLREELHLLEEQLSKSDDLYESELLAYKQRLLVDYLGKYVDETSAECTEKGQFLKAIWNLLVRIFEGLCERLVNEAKRKESQFLREQLATHSSYQTKLEEYQTQNAELKQSDDKYQNIVRELMTNIAKLNAELKGQRALFDKTAFSLSELTQKYGQLRSEYLEILVNGFSETMTRERAETHLTDKELLLFAKQLATGNHGVRAKKGRARRERKVDNNLDVGLLLEELEADDDYSFQLDAGQHKEVTYANQRTQTAFVGYQGENMGVQCDYVSRSEEGQLRNRSAQTNPPPRLIQRERQDQTDPSELLKKQFEVGRCFSYTQYPIRVEARESIKLIRNSSKENFMETLGSRKQPQMQDAATCVSYQTLQTDNLRVTDSNQIPGDAPPLQRRESKMIRISQSRQSKRMSKTYQMRVKTDTNENSIMNSRSGNRGSRDGRVSQFLVLEKLRQNMIKNVSNFKKSQIAGSVTLQVRLRRTLLDSFKPNQSLQTAISTVLPGCQSEMPEKQKEFIESIRNVQLSKVNEVVREKIVTWEALHNRKVSAYLPAHKCLRGISEVYKLAKRFLAIGCNSINLVTLTCEWLSAIEGKPVTVDHNPKKLIDFLRSCLNLYGEHYLIRNFVMLCGLEGPGKDERLVKMSKISFDSLRQKVEGDRLNRTSEFKFHRQARQPEKPQHPQAYLLYSSEVAFYFDLLDSLNCSDSRDDLSRYYTTYDRFEEVIPKISLHYRNSPALLAEITESVRLSVQDWGNENQSKLNIFKCIQLILERILLYKAQVETEFTKILQQTGDTDLTENLLGLSGVPLSQYVQTLIIAHQCYPNATPCDLATLFLVQGLKIDLAPFAIVEKDHKVTIIKRLLANRQKQHGLALSILQSFEKRMMKKTDFHLLLRSLWNKQACNILDGMLGENLQCLYACSVPYGQSEAGVGFHRTMRQALRLW